MDTGLMAPVKSIFVLICLMFSGFIKPDMITEGQVMVLNQGDNIILSCQFIAYGFDLFNNPIIWMKTQGREAVVINIMSNFMKPFVNKNRFGVTFKDNAPTYAEELSIMNLTQEDSGNYTCEIRTPEGAILAQVTHYVFVRAYVETLALTNINTTGTPKHRHRMTFNEVGPKANILRCVSVGGYPPPEMRVYIGSIEISNQLQWNQTSEISGRKGLRLMKYKSERYSYNFKAEPQYDGMEITCAVNVPGYGSVNHTLATMEVNYIPIIQCFDNSAELGDDLVHVTCDIQAKPPVKTSHWVLDNNGTIMSVPSVMDHYWTVQDNKSKEVLRSTLYIKKAKESSFRTYELVAENMVGVSAHAARLIRIRSHPTEDTLQMIAPKPGYRRNSNIYIYRPANGSNLTFSPPRSLSLLVLCGTVLLLCKYLLRVVL